MTIDTKPLAFIMVAPVGSPQLLPGSSGAARRAPTIKTEAGPGIQHQSSIVRALRPDLLLALAGFLIGALALLLVHSAEPTPPPPSGGTDLLIQAAAQITSEQPARSRS